jgi:uncharacterized protein
MEVVKRFHSGPSRGSFSNVKNRYRLRVEREGRMSKVVHFEIPADDTDRAKEFWSGVFGIDWQSYDGPVEYYMFSNDDQQSGGGLMPRDGQNGLTIYFAVEDLDAAREKVQQLGGSVEEKSPVPGMGWFAHAKDTEGNAFSMWQNDENAPAPEEG